MCSDQFEREDACNEQAKEFHRYVFQNAIGKQHKKRQKRTGLGLEQAKAFFWRGV